MVSDCWLAIITDSQNSQLPGMAVWGRKNRNWKKELYLCRCDPRWNFMTEVNQVYFILSAMPSAWLRLPSRYSRLFSSEQIKTRPKYCIICRFCSCIWLLCCCLKSSALICAPRVSAAPLSQRPVSVSISHWQQRREVPHVATIFLASKILKTGL